MIIVKQQPQTAKVNDTREQNNEIKQQDYKTIVNDTSSRKSIVNNIHIDAKTRRMPIMNTGNNIKQQEVIRSANSQALMNRSELVSNTGLANKSVGIKQDKLTESNPTVLDKVTVQQAKPSVVDKVAVQQVKPSVVNENILHQSNTIRVDSSNTQPVLSKTEQVKPITLDSSNTQSTKVSSNKNITEKAGVTLNNGQMQVIASSSSAPIRVTTVASNLNTGLLDTNPVNKKYEASYHQNISMDENYLSGKPIYCLQYNYYNPGNTPYVMQGSNTSKFSDGAYYILTHGFDGNGPIKGLTDQQSYIATQVALWMFEGGKFGTDYMYLSPNYVEATNSSSKAILNAAQELCNSALHCSSVNGEISTNGSTFTGGVTGGKELSQVIEYSGCVLGNPNITLENAPKGAKIVNLHENSNGTGTFQIECPDTTFTGNITAKITADKGTVVMHEYIPQGNSKAQILAGFTLNKTPQTVTVSVAFKGNKPAPKPVQKGNVVVQVYNKDGSTVSEIKPLGYNSSGDVGQNIPHEGFNLPKGYKIESAKIIVGGKTITLTPQEIKELQSTGSGGGTVKVGPNGDIVLANSSSSSNVPTKYVNGTIKIIYTIGRVHPEKEQEKYIVQNIMVTQEGHKIIHPMTKIGDGAPGSTFNDNKLSIPKGYHLDKITMQVGNGTPKVITENTLPTKIQDGNTTIVWIVSPDTKPAPKPTPKGKSRVEVINITNPQKPVVIYNKPYEGDIGQTFPDKPTIPKGYHIVKILENNNQTPENKLTNKFQKTPAKIVYQITKDTPKPVAKPAPKGKSQVEVINITNPKKPVVVFNKPYEGEIGKTFPDNPTIPKGYHVVSITQNNVSTPQNKLNNKFQKTKTTIIYKIVKDAPKKGKAIVKVLLPDGKVIYTKPYEGPLHGHFKGEPPIPKGYHITKITQNGKVVKNPNDILTNPEDKIIYHIAPDPGKGNVKVIIQGQKEPIENKNYTGPLGKKFDGTPIIPKGYHIIKIIQNGKVVKNPNDIYQNPTDKIVYIIGKDAIPKPKTITKTKIVKEQVPHIINHTVYVNHTKVEKVPEIHNVVEKVPVVHNVVQSVPAPQPVIEKVPTPQPVVQQVPVEQATLPHTGLPINKSGSPIGEVGAIAGVASISLLEILRRLKGRK